MPKQLTRKEKLFACVYAKTRDARAAAACAGFAMPQLAAHRLLARDDVSSEIRKQIEGAGKMPGEAAQGYRRLSFGSAADAVRLMKNWDGITQEEIEKLDLFNVAEIKLPKSGGIEIKFFDRLKALEKLENACKSAEVSGSALLEALREGAGNLGGDEP